MPTTFLVLLALSANNSVIEESSGLIFILMLYCSVLFV
ncbi:hypothetical protein M6B38_417365 [Iris pallida]|uniref:NADH dehydrogenase subunit 4L n=1 Tax=Iris pallida TaxID=29817 RepID=A0AAX6FIQ5_IRIPA|nr:hypothetical protein M6B38_417365 [Iris pallida]